MTRPSSDRDGECICDYNPTTTDGPQEDCPFHGRPYAYWIERGDELQRRLATAAETVLAAARAECCGDNPAPDHCARADHSERMAFAGRLAAAVRAS